MATVFARNVAFLSGSVLAVLILLTVWDEDVINVEHMLTIMTICGALLAGSKVFIPNENLVYCPERTLTQVIAHIHYFPIQWKGQAHAYKVMSELDVLFRYTAMYLLDELLSPIVTPLILIFQVSNKSQEIVDFFRNFTVDVVGVGDVCSFAQMDVRRHGNPAWQGDDHKTVEDTVARSNGYTQAEDGKTEMSLVHFTLTNPGWKPSGDNERYLAGLKTAGPPGPVPSPPPDNVLNSCVSPVLRGGISRCTGPLISSGSFLGPLPSLSNVSSRLMTPSYHNTPTVNTNIEMSQADMAMSALYLHHVNHHRARHHHQYPRQNIEQVSGYRFSREDTEDDRDLLLPSLSSSS